MDILTAIAVELPCNVCGGRYRITLRQVLQSKEALHDGCLARSETEYPPLAYAGLLDRELIEEFLRTWESASRKQRTPQAES